MSVWNGDTTCYLVELYEKHSCLYNMRSSTYYNKKARHVALKTIVQAINAKFNTNMTTDLIVKKINGLRSQFNEAKKTGDDKRKWWLYDRLSFLEPHIQGRDFASATKRQSSDTCEKESVSPLATMKIEVDPFQDIQIPEGSFEAGQFNELILSPQSLEEEHEEASGSGIQSPVPSKKKKLQESAAIASIAQGAIDAMAAVVDKRVKASEEGDHIEKSLSYIGSELHQLQNPKTANRLIRNFIKLVHEAQENEEN